MAARTEPDRRPAAGSWWVWKRVLGSLGLTLALVLAGAGLVVWSLVQDVLSDPFGWAFERVFGSGYGVQPRPSPGDAWLPWALLLAVLAWLFGLWLVWQKPVRRALSNFRRRRRGGRGQ